MANTSDIRNGLCIRYNHDIFKIIDESPKFLKVEGRLFIEHGYNQGVKVKKYLQKKSFCKIKQYQDLNQKIRVTSGTKIKV